MNGLAAALDVKELLAAVALVQGVLLVLLWLWILGAGDRSDRRADRDRRRAHAASLALSAGLARGDPDEGLRELESVSTTQQLDAVSRLTTAIAGTERERLHQAALRVGLTDRALHMAASRRWVRRLRGARMLGLVGGGTQTMIGLLRDSDEEVRAEAAEWAADHPEPRVIELLLEMLDDGSARVRFAATDSLARLGRPVVELLLARIGGLSGEAQATALKLAARIPDPRMLPIALAGARSPDREIRAAALGVLGAVGGREATEALTNALADPEPRVRAEAAAGIGALRHWPAATRLAGLLGDPVWRVRREAALALRSLGDAGILLLRRALEGDDPDGAEIAGHVLDLPAMTARELRL